ncbi:MAG: hypothetical protein JNN20_01170 [Betaproteobacteria bacterium]|nr:hypothetical protein [Betaproteobacteria bacterium]
MDKDRELAGKVDALLGRHSTSPRPADTIDDRNVPVLTELINAPTWEPAPVDTADILKQLSEPEVDALSQEIFTRVYGKLDRELANKLEDRIAAQLATQINLAITNVITDMRQEIANEIGDAVNAALADKLRQK